MRQLQVAPGFSDRVPVDFQPRVSSRCGRNIACNQPPHHGQRHAGNGHIAVPNFGNRHKQPARNVAQQNRYKGTHLHHAVAAGELSLRQHLRQVGKLDRAKQRGVQAHQKRAEQQHGDMVRIKPIGGQQHDADLQVLHKPDHRRLVVFVSQLPCRGAEQQKRQNEQCTNRQPGHRWWQPTDA